LAPETTEGKHENYATMMRTSGRCYRRPFRTNYPCRKFPGVLWPVRDDKRSTDHAGSHERSVTGFWVSSRHILGIAIHAGASERGLQFHVTG
jgi:hypothetical protein